MYLKATETGSSQLFLLSRLWQGEGRKEDELKCLWEVTHVIESHYHAHKLSRTLLAQAEGQQRTEHPVRISQTFIGLLRMLLSKERTWDK